jgi:two-component system, sensor histidine kinase LadS
MPLPKLLLPLIVFYFLLAGKVVFAQQANGNTFYLYKDSSKKITAEQALALFRQGRFTKTTSNEINIGFTRSLFWLAYQNEAAIPPDSLLIYIGHHHINRIHFYYADDSSLQQQWLTGDYYPFAQRPVNATGFYFPIDKKGIYLAQVDKTNESLQLSFKVISIREALSTESDHKLIMALFTGMILLLIIFGVYLFAISGNKVYLYYILYITTGWLWVLTNAGYGFQFFWPKQEWFASKARPVFVAATLISSLLFLIQFIGGVVHKKTRVMVKGLNILILCCIIIIMVINQQGYDSRWWLYSQYLIPVFSLFYLVLSLYILTKAGMRGNRQALFYLAAMLVLIVTSFLQVSFWVGGIHTGGNFFSHFGLTAGFIVQALILTAGLAYSFNQYRVDKEQLLIEMNERQQANTRILMEVQEAERSQVANQLHDVAGSLLSAAKLNLSSLREKEWALNEATNFHLQKTEEAVSLVSDMVRNLSHALSPVMLEKVGLKTSLEKVIAIANASGKIKIQLLVMGFEKYDPLLNNYYTALYSIIYELLNNIVKHSGAKNVLLQLAENDNCFSLIAEDDGIGIAPGEIEKKQSFGITAIQSKVAYFRGSIAIDNIQPNGLMITIEIPFIHDDK